MSTSLRNSYQKHRDAKKLKNSRPCQSHSAHILDLAFSFHSYCLPIPQPLTHVPNYSLSSARILASSHPLTPPPSPSNPPPFSFFETIRYSSPRDHGPTGMQVLQALGQRAGLGLYEQKRGGSSVHMQRRAWGGGVRMFPGVEVWRNCDFPTLAKR